MLSVVIATHDSERALLPTLAALVPGAAAGLVREVIVADAGSRDATSAVADAAGCRILVSDAADGVRLKAAAAQARGAWLMFLRPGVVPDPTWVTDVSGFIETAELRGQSDARAAVFRASPAAERSPAREVLALVKTALGALPGPQQGLVIHRLLYEAIGGHRSDAADSDRDIIRRLGRGRITLLRSGAATIT